MRRLSLFAALAVIATLTSGYTTWLIQGNDAGGIIAWPVAAQTDYRLLAAQHCAGYDKVAVITSVHRRAGDYVGFACSWGPKIPGWPGRRLDARLRPTITVRY